MRTLAKQLLFNGHSSITSKQSELFSLYLWIWAQNNILYPWEGGMCLAGATDTGGCLGFHSMLICPFAEVHPLLGVKGDGKSKKKQAGRPKGSKGKEKDSPFKPKLYKGDRGLPLEGSAKGKVQAELSQPLTGKDTLGALSGLLRGLALYSP